MTRTDREAVDDGERLFDRPISSSKDENGRLWRTPQVRSLERNRDFSEYVLGYRPWRIREKVKMGRLDGPQPG